MWGRWGLKAQVPDGWRVIPRGDSTYTIRLPSEMDWGVLLEPRIEWTAKCAGPEEAMDMVVDLLRKEWSVESHGDLATSEDGPVSCRLYLDKGWQKAIADCYPSGNYAHVATAFCREESFSSLKETLVTVLNEVEAIDGAPSFRPAKPVDAKALEEAIEAAGDLRDVPDKSRVLCKYLWLVDDYASQQAGGDMT